MNVIVYRHLQKRIESVVFHPAASNVSDTLLHMYVYIYI